MKEQSRKRRTKYEKVALDFEQGHVLTGYHHYRRLEITLSFLKNLGSNLLVLDAGCGDGIQMEHYFQCGKVFGLDISLTRLQRAKERFKQNSIIVQGDLFDMPIKEHYFDVVILGEVIEHLEEPLVVLQEIRRILKPFGHLILDTPSKSNAVDILLRLFGINLTWGYEVDKTHLWFFTMTDVVNILKKAGFAIIKTRGGPFVRYNLPIIHHCTWVKSRWWVYRLFDYTLGNLPIFNRLGAIQVFMAKKA